MFFCSLFIQAILNMKVYSKKVVRMTNSLNICDVNELQDMTSIGRDQLVRFTDSKFIVHIN